MAISDAGCEPARLRLAAGPTRFRVKNKGTAKVSEFEVLDGAQVLGEVENVTAGASGEFTLNLERGTFDTKCPGGASSAQGILTVTGEASETSADLVAAVTRYEVFAEQEAADLVRLTEAFTGAVKAGDVALAKQRYSPAHVPYERIEPIAESFGDLDAAIDGRAEAIPVERLTGFHRLEHALWAVGSTAGMAPVADRLVADVKGLQRRTVTIDLDFARVANGATELLREISRSKVTGEEERYSRTDLVDVAANIEGALAVFDAVRVPLDDRDARLGRTIEARFGAVGRVLAPFRRGAGFVPYNALTSADVRALTQSIDALGEPLSELAAAQAKPR